MLVGLCIGVWGMGDLYSHGAVVLLVLGVLGGEAQCGHEFFFAGAGGDGHLSFFLSSLVLSLFCGGWFGVGGWWW